MALSFIFPLSNWPRQSVLCLKADLVLKHLSSRALLPAPLRRTMEIAPPIPVEQATIITFSFPFFLNFYSLFLLTFSKLLTDLNRFFS